MLLVLMLARPEESAERPCEKNASTFPRTVWAQGSVQRAREGEGNYQALERRRAFADPTCTSRSRLPSALFCYSRRPAQPATSHPRLSSVP